MAYVEMILIENEEKSKYFFGNLMDPCSIHISIILSTLDLSHCGFVFGFLFQKTYSNLMLFMFI